MSNIFFWLPMEDQAKVYAMMWPGNWKKKKKSSSSASQSKDDASGSGQKKKASSYGGSRGSKDGKTETEVETVEYKGT